MSVKETNNGFLVTNIKIELEKVYDGEPPDDYPTTTIESTEARNKDTMNIISNNIETIRVQAREQVNDETLRSSVISKKEVPTGARFFKGLDRSNPPENHQSLLEGSSDSAPVNSKFDKHVLPLSDNESASSSNTSHLSIIKPPSYKDMKYGKVELYAPDIGPRIYNVKGNIVSQPLITKNLPEAFRAQPVHGKPESKEGLQDFYEQKIRDYLGYGLSDTEFERLHEFMDGEYLRTGLECTTSYSFPSQGTLSVDLKTTPMENGAGRNLCIVKKLHLRIKKDPQKHYPRKLKYRGLRMLPLSSAVYENYTTESNIVEAEEEDVLEPGRDLIFRARIYRPHSYGSRDQREQKPTRHSVFNNDLVALGRQPLTAFRDRITCANDIGMRVDVADSPDFFTTESAKKIFPSGFLFINNVFYVDSRPGCKDHTGVIREWARERRLGDFPVRNMCGVRLDEVVLRLGHPEVYMHQGKCEHLFTFSEVRLLGPTDPLRISYYPCFTYITQNQSVYCTTCAEFGAKWIVVGCVRVPFDPAFFCETCFRIYLYDKDGRKIGNFKAYSYKGSMVNFLKPTNGQLCAEEGQAEVAEQSD